MNSSNFSAAQRGFIARVSAVAALGGLLFGFDTAIISGAIPYIRDFFKLDSYMQGWTVSSILIGCAIGALLAGGLADRFGRKSMLIVCAFLFALSGIGTAFSHNLSVFIAFRLIGGLGVGAAAMISPMYIAETSPAAYRGRLVSLYQLAIVLGILLAYFSNYYFDDFGVDNWRWMFASQAAPSILFAVLLLMLPETPRWLVKRGRDEQALQVLEKINGEASAKTELAQIRESFTNVSAVSIAELFSTKYRKAVVIGILIAVFQQITGINSIMYYAPVIFKETGIDSASSMLQTIIIGAVNVLATFVAIGLVDKVGRRAFLLYGSILMGISLIGVGVCFQIRYFDNFIVLVFVLIYVAAFACTLGAVTWVYLSEIFSNRIRALAMSVATLALWLADFLVTYTFPIMTSQLGTAYTLFYYAGCFAVAFVYMLLKVPETKGRTLEEIEILLSTN